MGSSKIEKIVKEEVEKQIPKMEFGVNLVTPSITEEKMEAVVNLSKAVLELCKTLNSANVQATISNNVVHNAGIGVNISSKD